MTKKSTIKIGDIVFDTSIYPRDKWQTHLIESYSDAIKSGAKFPAIIVEEGTNRLIDGLHRVKAHQRYAEEYGKSQNTDGWSEPQDELLAEFHVIPDGIPPKLYAASFSVNHGKRIAPAERRSIAREVYKSNPTFIMETLAKYLGVSKSSAHDYVSDIIAMQREERRNTAYRLHRLGWTNEEIGEVLGITGQAYATGFLKEFPELEKLSKSLLKSGLPVSEVAQRFNLPPILAWSITLDGKEDAKRLDALDIKIQPYDVWNFVSCNDLFGDDHPGRIPGQVVAHVLYFFTNEGDVVIDPMAGSGTTSDVCLSMGRKCYAYDIDDRHKRADIIQHDMTEGWPDRIKKANLVFWDAPYFSKMDDANIGENGYMEGSISKLSREKYLLFFSDRLREAQKLARKGTKLAFLMSDWDDNTGKNDGIFIWDYANLIASSGWNLMRHIQVPLSTQQVHPDIVNKFRLSRRLARLERYLLIAELK